MKKTPSLIGFLQALGVGIYCALIAGLFSLLEKSFATPGYLGFALMLILLVFSAAVCGFLVFGYPVYLLLNKQTKEALLILGFSALWFVEIIAVSIILITIFR
jgi:hypothetical protein